VRGFIAIIAALMIIAALPVAGSAAVATKPSLRAASTSPLTLRGAGFKAVERVRVTARVDGARLVRIVRATRTGTFTVVFTGVSPRDPCTMDGFAAGAAGSRAVLKLPERMCPMPLDAPGQ